jgi:hypothetical protein
MCRKLHRRKLSLFYKIGFITFDTTNNPKCITTTPRWLEGKNIINMRYIFIPIHQGLHFTCALIYMEQKKIEYYNSLCFDNVTRHGCRHKIEMPEDTLQVLVIGQLYSVQYKSIFSAPDKVRQEKAILFCWQIILLFVLSFLSRPAIFVWGRMFLQFEWYHFAHSFIFEWGKFDPIH